MTRRRWIADRVSGDRAILLGRNAEHLARSLRARVGQEFEVSTGQQVRLGRVVQVADDRVELELKDVVGQIEDATLVGLQANAIRIVLLLSIFKFDRFEWAVEKTTELGVAEIIPVIARRTDTHLASAAIKRVERWRRIALEASQQSRRISPPEISAAKSLKHAIETAAQPRTEIAVPTAKIVLAENERALTLKQAVAEASEQGTENNQKQAAGILPETRPVESVARPPVPRSIALAIGPEGGWTADELAIFTAANWTAASLGKTILRAETAAIAAVSIVTSALS